MAFYINSQMQYSAFEGGYKSINKGFNNSKIFILSSSRFVSAFAGLGIRYNKNQYPPHNPLNVIRSLE